MQGLKRNSLALLIGMPHISKSTTAATSGSGLPQIGVKKPTGGHGDTTQTVQVHP